MKEYEVVVKVWVEGESEEDAEGRVADLLSKAFRRRDITDYDGPLEEVVETEG